MEITFLTLCFSRAILEKKVGIDRLVFLIPSSLRFVSVLDYTREVERLEEQPLSFLLFSSSLSSNPSTILSLTHFRYLMPIGIIMHYMSSQDIFHKYPSKLCSIHGLWTLRFFVCLFVTLLKPGCIEDGNIF